MRDALQLSIIFLQAPMFDIFADCPKMEKFVPTNISYGHYRTLRIIISTLHHFHVQIAKSSTRKTRFK